MARTLENYRELVLMLLPRGDAWQGHADIEAYATAVAEEFVRVDARALQLLNESLPSRVTELIGEWEEDHGLPDSCAKIAETLVERRNVLINKIRGIEDQSRQTYIDRAAQLGYTITITEFAPGDDIPGYPTVPTSDAAYFIQINAPLSGYVHRRCGEPLGQLFASWVIEQMECALQQIKQSHMTLIFSYT